MAYKQWDEMLDAAMLVSVPDPSIVFQWREQAEKSMRNAGKGAMTEEEVKAFCDRYMPSYEAYMNRLAQDGIEGVALEKTLRFSLREDRQPYVSDSEEM